MGLKIQKVYMRKYKKVKIKKYKIKQRINN